MPELPLKSAMSLHARWTACGATGQLAVQPVVMELARALARVLKTAANLVSALSVKPATFSLVLWTACGATGPLAVQHVATALARELAQRHKTVVKPAPALPLSSARTESVR